MAVSPVSKIKLVVVSAEGVKSVLTPAEFARMRLLPGMKVGVLDETTGQAPKGLITKTQGKDLLLELPEHGLLAKIEGFEQISDLSFVQDIQALTAVHYDSVAYAQAASPTPVATDAGGAVADKEPTAPASGTAMGGFNLSTLGLVLGGLALAGGGGGGAAAAKVIVASVSGIAIDGYLSGSTVTRADGSGNSVTTDANGRYTGLTGSGPIKVTGGYQLVGGQLLPFEGTLLAPEGATVVTPITTLIQAAVADGKTLVQATALIKDKLNLPDGFDVLKVDPIAEVNSTTATPEQKAAALDVFKTGVAVATALQVAADSNAVGGNTAAAFTSAVGSLLNALEASTSTESGVQVVVNNLAAVGVGASDLAALQDGLIAIDAISVSQGGTAGVGNVQGNTLVQTTDQGAGVAATFTATPQGNTVTFGGSAIGAITIQVAENGTATFSRQGQTATGSVAGLLDAVTYDDILSPAGAALKFVIAGGTSDDVLAISAPNMGNLVLEGTLGGGQDSVLIKIADIPVNAGQVRQLSVSTAGLTGLEHLAFDFADVADTVVLTNSNFSNISTIEVKKGTTDISQITIADGTVFIINSGLELTLDQFKNSESVISASGLGELTILLSGATGNDVAALNTYLEGLATGGPLLIGTDVYVKVGSASEVLISAQSGISTAALNKLSGISYPSIPELSSQIAANDGDIASLVSRTSALEAAVNTLKGTSAGSVAKSIADAIGVPSNDSAIPAVTATGLWSQIETLVGAELDALQGQVTTLRSDITGGTITATGYNTLVKISNALAKLNDVVSVDGSVLNSIADVIGTAPSGWNTSTGTWSSQGTGLNAEVAALINGAVTFLKGQVTTLRSDITGGTITATGYDTLVEISNALAKLNDVVSVDGSVLNSIADVIGTAPSGWNTSTGTWSSQGTGLNAEVAALINGAVTFLKGQVTTLRSDITGGTITATGYDTLVKISNALAKLNDVVSVDGSVLNSIADVIGTAPSGWNTSTGTWSSQGTGLNAEVAALINGAVTFLKGQVTTLRNDLTGGDITAETYKTILDISNALETLNAGQGTVNSVAYGLLQQFNTLTANYQTAIKVVALVPTLTVFGGDLADSVLETQEDSFTVRVNLSQVTAANDTIQMYLGTTAIDHNGGDAGTAYTILSADITAGYKDFVVPQNGLGASGDKAIFAKVTSGSVTSNSSAGLYFTYSPDAAGPTAVATISDISSDSGTSDNDYVTNQSIQTVTGTLSAALAAGEKVQVTADGSNWFDATVGGTTWFAPALLSSGSGTLTVRTIDAAGNVTNGAATRGYTLDTAAPTTPTISGGATVLTNDNTPSLEFTTAPGAYVSVIISGSVVNQGVANGSGVYTFTPTAAMTDGNYSVTARASDAAGNLSGLATVQLLTIDSAAPNAPVITSAALSNDSTPIITGTAAVGSTVSVVVAGATYSVTATDGTWSVDTTPTTGTAVTSGTLAINANGNNSVSVTATDAASNTSAAATQTLVIDTTLPTVTITDDKSATTNGEITYTITFSEAVNGFTQSDVTVTNGTVRLFNKSSDTVYQMVVTPDANEAGDITVDIAANVATDAAGNNNTAATQNVQAFDTAAPSAPAITDSQGADDNAVLTNDSTPALVITAATGSTVGVYMNGAYVGNATESVTPGTFNFTSPELNDGVHHFTAKATDVAGNVSVASVAQSLTVDATAPVYQSLEVSAARGGVALIAGSTLKNGDVVTVTATYDGVVSGTPTAPSLTIGAESGLALSAGVTSGNTRTWTYTISGAGTTDTGAIAVVGGTFTTGITDAAGNVATGAVTASNNAFVADTTAPTVTITDDKSATTNGEITYTITFSEAVNGFTQSDVTVTNGTVRLFNKSSDTVYQMVVTPDANEAGDITVDIAANVATDAAGNNNTAATQNVQAFDTAAPSAPVINTVATDDIVDALENAQGFTITGTGETGSTVTLVLSSGRTLTGGNTATVVDGAWSLAVAANEAGQFFKLGDELITVYQTDAVGNVSAEAKKLIDVITTVVAGGNLSGQTYAGVSKLELNANSTLPTNQNGLPLTIDAKGYDITIAGTIDLTNTTITNVKNLVISNNVTATLTVSQASAFNNAGDITLNGNGTVSVTASGNLTAFDLDKVSLIMSGATTLPGTSALPDAINANNHTITIADTVNVSGVNLSNVATISVLVSGDLTIAASQVTGKTVSGLGSVVVAGLQSGTDLTNVNPTSGVTATVTADLDVTANANLSNVDYFQVANTFTLTATATQVNGRVVTGAGDVEVTNLAANTNLSGVNPGAGVKAFVNDSIDVTANTNLGNVDIYTVASTKTLTANASQVTGRTVDGAGAISILALAANTDLTNVNPTAGVSATVSSTIDITANTNLGNIDSYSVDASRTLTAKAAQMTGMTATGSGTIAVTALDDTATANLSLLNTSSVTASAIVDNETVTFTGNFGKAAVSISGVVDVNNDIFNIDGATMGTATFSTGSGVILQGTANKLNGVVVTGHGTVQVSALHLTPSADLGGLDTTSVTAAFNGTGEFTGTLDGAVVTVGNGFTMTAAASKVAGETINKTGSGALAVTVAGTDAAINLTTIGGSALSSVTVTESLTFTGTLDDAVATTVANGVVLTTAASKVTGKSVVGLGGAVITGLTSTSDLAGVVPDAGVTIDLANASVSMTAGGKIGVETLNVISTGGAGSLDLTAITSGDMDATSLTAQDGVTVVVTATQVGSALSMATSGSANTSKFVIVAENGNNISAGGLNVVVPTRYDLTLANNASVTMSVAQHNGAGAIAAAGTADQITFSDAGTVTGKAAVEGYVLAAGNDTFTLGAADQNVDTGAGTNEIITGAVDDVNGTLGGTGTDTLTLDDGDNIADATVTAVENATVVGSVTMTLLQHNALAISAAGFNDTVTLTTAGTATGDADIQSYVLAAGNDTFTLGAADQNVDTGAGTNEIITGAVDDVNGTLGGTGTDTLTLDDGDNIADATVTAVENATVVGSVTMTLLQHNALAISAAGFNDTVTLTTAGTATGDADIQSYVLAAGNDTFTLGAADQNVDTGAGTNEIITGAVDDVNGTLGGTGTDTLTLDDGDNIADATVTAVENATVVGSVTMTLLQHNALAISAAGFNDTVTLTTAGTATGDADIQSYVLAAGNDTFTLGAADQNVDTGAGTNEIITGAVDDVNGTLGGTGTDTLTLDDGDNIADATVTAVENATVVGSVTMTLLQHNALAISAAGFNDTVTLTTAGTATGDADIQSYVLAAGNDTFTLGAADQNVDTGAGTNEIITGAVDDVNGTLGGTGTDTLTLDDGDNIADATVTAVENATVVGSVTMTLLQHNALAISAAGFNDTVTLTTAGTATGDADIQSYVLAAGNDTFTLGAADQNVDTGAGTNEIITGAVDDVNGTLGGTGTDTLTLDDGDNIADATVTAVENATVVGSVTMTLLQHNALAISAAGFNDTVTLTTAGTATGDADIQSYVLAAGNDTFTLGAADQNVDTGAGTNEIITGAVDDVNGTLGGTGTDTLTLDDGDNIADATVTAVENATVVGSVTMTLLQHNALAISAAGFNDTVTLTTAGTATGDADIQSYVLAAGNDTFTLGAADQNVDTGAGTNEIITGAVDDVNGTLGGTGTDTLTLDDGDNIADATVTAVENATVVGSVTMTLLQHNALAISAAGFNDTVTLTTAGTATGDADIQSYVLAAGNDTFTLGAADQNVDTGAGTNEIITGAVDDVNGTLGGTGTDTLTLDDGDNIADATVTAVENATVVGSVTMTLLQHNALAISAAGFNDTVTLTTAGTATGDADIQSYVLAAGNDTFTLGAADQNVDTGAGTNEIITGAVDDVNGTLGGTGTDTLTLDDGDNIADATVTAVENATVVGSVTMTLLQHNALAISAAGFNDTVTLTTAGTATGDADIQSYVLAAGNDTFTLGAADQNVDTGAGTNEIITGAVDDVNGTLGGTGTDTLTLDDGDNIADATVTAVENATVVGSVTMTLLQHNALAISAAGFNDTVTLTTAGTATGDADIQSYVLAAGNDTFTLGAADQNVDTGAGTNEIITGAVDDVNGTLGGTGTDTLTLDDGDNIADATVTAVENATVVGSVTMTLLQHNALAISAAGFNDTVTLTTAGTATGDADIQSYVLAAGSNTFTLGASGQNVTGGTGADTINTGALTTISGDLNGGSGTSDKLVVANDVDALNAAFSNIETIEIANAKTLVVNVNNVTGLAVVNSVGGDGTLSIAGWGFGTNVDLSRVTTTGLKFDGNTNRDVELADGTTFTMRQAHLASMNSISDDGAGGASVVLTEVDGTVDLSEIDVLGSVTARLVDADVNLTTRGSTLDDVTAYLVQDARTLTLTAAQATGRTITAEAGVTGAGGSITVTSLVDGTAYSFANIAAGAIGAGTAAGSFEVSVATTQALHAGTNLGAATVSLTSNAALTMTASQANSRAITGAGTVVLNGGLTGPITTNLSAINTNGISLVLNGDVVFNGTFSTSDPLTVNTDTTARSINISGATGLPTGFSLDNDVTMTLTNTQANALAVAGTGQVVVTGVSGTVSTDYSGIDVATKIMLTGATTFTGTFDSASTLTVDGAYQLDISGAGSANHPGAVVLANNAVLKMTAAQADALGVTGTGSVLITDLQASPAVNLSGVNPSGSVDAAVGLVNQAVNFTGNLGKATVTISGTSGGGDDIFNVDSATMGTATFSVGANAILQGTAAKLTGKTATGVGTVTVSGLESTDNADLSGLQTTTVNATLAFATVAASSTTETFTGNFGKAAVKLLGEYSQTNIVNITGATVGTASFAFGTGVANAMTNVELRANAAQLDGRVATGSGGAALTVYALQAASNTVDLSGMNVYTTNYYYGGLADSTVNFAGKLGYGTLLLQGGTAGGADAVFNIDSATLAASTEFNVGSDIVLQGSAAKLTGKTATGSGKVAITSLHATLSADLSGIDATTTTAAFDGTGVFTGTLDGAVVTVGDGFTMTAAASKVAGETVNKVSTGKLAVTIDGSDAAAILTNIAGNAFDSVTVTGDVTFTGALDDALATAVNTGVTFTSAASVVTGKTLTGVGSVVVTGLANATNLANLNSTLNVTAVVTADTDISANINLGTVDAYQIVENVTLTMTSAQATGKTVTALGSLVLTDTTIAASLLNTLDTSVAGLINASNASAINGTSAAIKTAIDASDAQLQLGTNFSSTVTGAALASELLAIAAANGTGTVNVANATSITGTAAELVSVINNSAEFAINGSVNLIASGSADISQAGTIYNAINSGTKTFAIADNFSAVQSGNATVLAAATSVTANGTNTPNTIDMSAFTTLQSLIIDGKEDNDTLYGSPNADVLYGGEGADTLRGGNGGDTLWGGDGTNADTESDIFQFSSIGQTATTTASYSGNNTTFSIPGSGMDVLRGDISDIVDLIGTSGWTAVTNVAVQTNGAIDKSVFATSGRDAVVFKDGANYYVAFETANGTAGTFGNLEIAKLVGIVDDTNQFSVAANSSLTFIV
ncbi:hypothetical protein ACHEXK_01110 [Limnohabitans sp. DCL3]|uniref:hypothetical protein n=1 Tax=Limnohabitans sp. DCL3 TaxID=3374103 RepID=UPI003A87DB66